MANACDANRHTNHDSGSAETSAKDLDSLCFKLRSTGAHTECGVKLGARAQRAVRHQGCGGGRGGGARLSARARC